MTVSSSKEEGDRFYKAGRFHEAIVHYTNAIDTYRSAINTGSHPHPQLHLCYSNRCACYLRLSNTAAALADAEECVRLKPSWFKGHSRKGECLMRLGRIDEAIRSYEQVLQCDRNNTEAINAIASARRRSDYSSSNSSSSSNNRNRNSSYSSSNNHSNGYYTNSSEGNTRAQPNAQWLTGAAQLLQRGWAQVLGWWLSLSQQTQQVLQLGLLGLVAYILFFGWPFSSGYGYGYDSYGSYGSYGGFGGYGYGGGGGGLTWMQWALVMGAAYKLPPMFPDLLGDFARPFFGMNWATFMWVLNMLTANRRGGGGGGGYGYGPRGYGGGGMFGRRRYY